MPLTGMFVEAWNHRDPNALAALFDTDAEFVNVTGLWWRTRDLGGTGMIGLEPPR